MALTLSEAQNLSQNMLRKGIVELLVKEIPLFRLLPFVTIEGNALAVNREDTSNMGSVSFKGINGNWTSDEAETTQVTFSLYTLGGQADVDNLIQKSMSNFNDQMAAQVAIKTKLMGHEFESRCIYGDASVSNGFTGLHALMDAVDDGVQTLHMSENDDGSGDVLSMKTLDEAIDNCKRAGTPGAIILAPAMMRSISQYLRSVGSNMSKRDEYGHQWEVWGTDEVPFVVSDQINIVETIGNDNKYSGATGGATTSIFVVHFGEGDGLVGVQNGGIVTEQFDKLESKDASRTRVKWYTGIALYSTLAVVRIDGILPNGTVTA